MEINGFEHMSPYQLGETGRAEAIPYLVRYLERGGSNSKRLAASAIGKLSSGHKNECEVTVPLLISCLKDPHPQVRQYCLKTLVPFRIPRESILLIQNIADADKKDYNRELAKKIISQQTKIRPTPPQENLSERGKELVTPNFLNADRSKIDAYYDEGGYYSYVLLSKIHDEINQDDIHYVTKKLKQIGVITILSGRSYRPADNGRQYEFYLRVSNEQGAKPNKQNVEDFLGINKKNLYETTQSEQLRADNQQYQETIKREQQEKENTQTQLRASKREIYKSQEEINRLQSALKQLLRDKEFLLSKIEGIHYDYQNTFARLKEEKAIRAGARDEKSFSEELILELENRIKEMEKDSKLICNQRDIANEEAEYIQDELHIIQGQLENRIEELEEDIKLTCSQRDIAKAEVDKTQEELYIIQGQYDLLKRQLNSKVTSTSNREKDFQKFLKCLLPNLEIHDASVSFLTEIKDCTKILSKLYSLNIDPSSVKSQRFHEAGGGWLEMAYHFNIGDSPNGRIYYYKQCQNSYCVYVSSKQTQKKDGEKMKKWKN